MVRRVHSAIICLMGRTSNSFQMLEDAGHGAVLSDGDFHKNCEPFDACDLDTRETLIHLSSVQMGCAGEGRQVPTDTDAQAGLLRLERWSSPWHAGLLGCGIPPSAWSCHFHGVTIPGMSNQRLPSVGRQFHLVAALATRLSQHQHTSYSSAWHGIFAPLGVKSR